MAEQSNARVATTSDRPRVVRWKYLTIPPVTVRVVCPSAANFAGMTIPVAPDELQAVAGKYGAAAYVLTTGRDSRTHVTHAAVDVAEGTIRCRMGKGASANAIASPGVTVLWAATPAEPMSLIADGIASEDGEEGTFSIAVDSAMLHRAAPV